MKMYRLKDAWQQDETIRWVENGYWLFLGLAAKWPLCAWGALALWVLRFWRVKVIERQWRELLADAEAKGLFGRAKP